MVKADDYELEPEPAYLTNVLLLCVECRQPIKAVITTERWIKCEWISPEGDCRTCYQRKKEANDERGIQVSTRA